MILDNRQLVPDIVVSRDAVPNGAVPLNININNNIDQAAGDHLQRHLVGEGSPRHRKTFTGAVGRSPMYATGNNNGSPRHVPKNGNVYDDEKIVNVGSPLRFRKIINPSHQPYCDALKTKKTPLPMSPRRKPQDRNIFDKNMIRHMSTESPQRKIDYNGYITYSPKRKPPLLDNVVCSPKHGNYQNSSKTLNNVPKPRRSSHPCEPGDSCTKIQDAQSKIPIQIQTSKPRKCGMKTNNLNLEKGCDLKTAAKELIHNKHYPPNLYQQVNSPRRVHKLNNVSLPHNSNHIMRKNSLPSEDSCSTRSQEENDLVSACWSSPDQDDPWQEDETLEVFSGSSMEDLSSKMVLIKCKDTNYLTRLYVNDEGKIPRSIFEKVFYFLTLRHRWRKRNKKRCSASLKLN